MASVFLIGVKRKPMRANFPRMLAAVRLHPSVRPGCRQVNTTQVNRVDITSVSSIFTADLELRQQIRLLTQFLKENLPGYENCRVIGSGTTTGVRESRRVMGDYVIDADEMAEGCRLPMWWYIKHCSLSIYIILTEPDRRNRPYNIANHTICRIVVFSRWAWKGFWWRDDAYRVLTELTLPIVS